MSSFNDCFCQVLESVVIPLRSIKEVIEICNQINQNKIDGNTSSLLPKDKLLI